MGLIPDSNNPKNPIERKTSAQRSVRHPADLLDSHNSAGKIRTTVSTVDHPRASGRQPRRAPEGTTHYDQRENLATLNRPVPMPKRETS